MLKAETNTPEIEKEIIDAAHDSEQISQIHHNLSTAFEHDRWWVSCLDCGAQWGAVDYVTPADSTERIGFEEISTGDESCLDAAHPEEEANHNCLDGMKCPSCGSLEPYLIEVTTVVRFNDEGEDFLNDKGSDQEWNDESHCHCCECEFEGTVGEFRGKEKTEKKEVPAPLTSQELAQILAALRHWQNTQCPVDTHTCNAIKEEWDHFEDDDPMSMEEINDLCERLNFGPAIPEEGKANNKALIDACKQALGHVQLLGSGQPSPYSNAEMCEILGKAIKIGGSQHE